MNEITSFLQGTVIIFAVLLLIFIGIIIYVISSIIKTAKNTEDLNQIMADIDHNNQVRHNEILKELRRINNYEEETQTPKIKKGE